MTGFGLYHDGKYSYEGMYKTYTYPSHQRDVKQEIKHKIYKSIRIILVRGAEMVTTRNQLRRAGGVLHPPLDYYQRRRVSSKRLKRDPCVPHQTRTTGEGDGVDDADERVRREGTARANAEPVSDVDVGECVDEARGTKVELNRTPLMSDRRDEACREKIDERGIVKSEPRKRTLMELYNPSFNEYGVSPSILRMNPCALTYHEAYKLYRTVNRREIHKKFRTMSILYHTDSNLRVTKDGVPEEICDHIWYVYSEARRILLQNCVN